MEDVPQREIRKPLSACTLRPYIRYLVRALKLFLGKWIFLLFAQETRKIGMIGRTVCLNSGGKT